MLISDFVVLRFKPFPREKFGLHINGTGWDTWSVDRIIILVSRSSAVISQSYRRLFVKIAQVTCFEVSSEDKVPLEENYEKKLGDTRIPKLRQETQHMRRRRVPERLSHYSKNLSFCFHNIVRPHMFLREDMLWCASQARQIGFS